MAHNAYRTLELVSSSCRRAPYRHRGRRSRGRVRSPEPALAATLLECPGRPARRRGARRADRAASMPIKNTTGYGLNALLDYDTPLSMFAHLLVGSEGTLAFIAEAVLNTVPVEPYRATGLLLFPEPATACAAVDLPRRGRRVGDRTARPRVAAARWRTGPACRPGSRTCRQAARRCWSSCRAHDAADLAPPAAGAGGSARDASILTRPSSPPTRARQGEYWAVREGLFTSVGAARPPVPSVVLEDVTFPPDDLAAGRRRPHRPLRRARLRRRGRVRAREGRQPAFPPHAEIRRPGRGRALRGLHAGDWCSSWPCATAAPSRASTERAGTWLRSSPPSGVRRRSA